MTFKVYCILLVFEVAKFSHLLVLVAARFCLLHLLVFVSLKFFCISCVFVLATEVFLFCFRGG